MPRLHLPPKSSDAWWTVFMRENMDTMTQTSSMPNLDLALAQWNGKIALHKYRYPDGSDVKIRAIDFETDSDMEMFILRWVK